MAKLTICCPECQKKGRAPEESRGRKVRCPNCGTAFFIEASQEPGAIDFDRAARRLLQETGEYMAAQYPIPPRYMQALGELIRCRGMSQRLANYRRLRARVLRGERLFDLVDFDVDGVEELIGRRKFEEALQALFELMPAGLLTPRIHMLAGLAFEGLGDLEARDHEFFLKGMCRDWILLTGDGSQYSPYLVTSLEDTDDLLPPEQVLTRNMVFERDRTLEVFALEDGSEVWFDITAPLQAMTALA